MAGRKLHPRQTVSESVLAKGGLLEGGRREWGTNLRGIAAAGDETATGIWEGEGHTA